MSKISYSKGKCPTCGGRWSSNNARRHWRGKRHQAALAALKQQATADAGKTNA